ncbi:hypothetical protein K2P97_07645 [bacterium]|nr:hypothetical protein [bacterium]
MNKFNLAKIALVSSALLVHFAAQADSQIRQIADWSLYETDSGMCYIQTDNNDWGNGGDGGSFPTGATMFLSISKYKDRPEMPVEVMVKLASNSSKSKGVVASISGASNLGLADLDGSQKMFWGVPKNLSNFMNQIARGRDQIKLKGVGGRREEGRLSTNGFKDILREMETHCNAGQSIINAEFETNFFAGVADGLDPLRIDVTKAGQLRSVYYAAYKAAFNISNAANDLAKLLAKYQPLIDELATNRSEAKQIQEVNLPASRQLLADAQKQQVDARAEIARIDAAIPGLNAKIAASQKLYDAARAILAPHEPEYNRITGSLSSAQSALADAQNRLAYIDSRLRDGAQQLASLDAEADHLERNLSQKQFDLDRARSYLRDAQSRRANFNVQWERESRLRNNFEYSRLINDRSSFQNNLRQIEGDLQRTRMERDRIARDLQQCRQGMVIEAAEPRPPGGGHPPGGGGLVPGPRPPGGGGGLVPGPPGNPGNPGPGPVEPPPPRDCSHLENALNNANNMVAQRESEQRNIANRLNEVNSRMNQIERQIDWDVRREYDNLVSIEDQAEREVSRLQNDVSRDQNRISQIRGSDIPRLEREQTQLQNERPSVLSSISQNTSAVARLTEELSRFKSATDWDRKANEVQKTGNQLSSDQANLANAQAQKQAAQNRLQAGANTEAQAKAQIDALNARAAALDARKLQLDAGLAKLPEERAQFDATLAQQRVELTSRTAQFTDMLK